MAKKFITERELALVHSWSSELMQEVSKQDVLYYAIDYEASRVHDIYDEAVEKAYMAPVLISARTEFNQIATTVGNGVEDAGYTLSVELHVSECNQRNVHPREGDFIEHGQVMFEITTVGYAEAVFGQINDKMAYKLTCVPSRESQFKADSSTRDGVDNTHPVQPARPRSLGDDL
jgi:hypothetical protein